MEQVRWFNTYGVGAMLLRYRGLAPAAIVVKAHRAFRDKVDCSTPTTLVLCCCVTVG